MLPCAKLLGFLSIVISKWDGADRCRCRGDSSPLLPLYWPVELQNQCDTRSVVTQEANAINKSLTFLEQTVNALSKKDGHVPFRQSKLTSLLRDALGGNCKTV